MASTVDPLPALSEHAPRIRQDSGDFFGADPMLPAPYRIHKRRQELSDTFTLELAPADGSRSLAFGPGQFNMLYAFGAGEVPVSISGNPADPAALVHTIRAVGPVTEALWDLKSGDVLGVRGPFGAAWPVVEAEGSDVVIVAGGIGLAPLRPAIYHVLNQREKYGSVCIYYGARNPADILYRAELEKWRGQFDLFDPSQTVALVCGPEIMMRYAVKSLNQQGVANDRIYVSMERNMKCAVGFCGHCQLGPYFICRDGPVFRFDRIELLFEIREL